MDGRDYPVLMGLMMLGSVASCCEHHRGSGLCTLDPRIRYD